jgi:peptide-methionine (S)-S-oxide reductase
MARVQWLWALVTAGLAVQALAIRRGEERVAAFALGSFWRGEAVFGCVPGVVRTRAGYAGGAKANPDYHSVGDHAEALEVEYDPGAISFERLLEIFWANHDPTQVLGQGPDVGAQHRSATGAHFRSVIFTQTDEEAAVALKSKQAEQAKLGAEITTEIQPLRAFYPAEAEHQKLELRRKPQLLQLLGSDEDLTSSVLATKLNGYAANLCPANMHKLLDTKVRPFMQPRPTLLAPLR